MNQEITLDDYQSIGTMETALSEHADEAFFELSPERQKIAEKIFKCLTETDGENREIRRATTIEKLCAIADADFADVASVIEVFRKDGRTFLMPPPEVELNKNSLIDISHESLIRKWERLKNWVEEEGQSSRTYRRLAEDALLHQQGKMGFWNDPELKDALEWRENFKPNETWAQLYKETGERQFKAPFADAMQYLDESEINRDEEIAEDKRQQDALKSYAAKLRWAAVGLLILFIASLGVAGYAWYQKAETVRINEELTVEKNNAEDFGKRLQDTATKLTFERRDKDKAFEDLKDKKDELEVNQKELSESLTRQEAATKKAEDEKKRADEQTRQAILSKAEKEQALVKQTQLTKEREIAVEEAIEKKKEAEKAQKKAEERKNREELNRKALTYLEQGEFAKAEPIFTTLLGLYEKESDEEERIDGMWWTSHNLGIAHSKLDNYDLALSSYLKARSAIASARKGQTKDRDDEINRSLATTFRRLGQLNREKALSVTDDDEADRFNERAIGYYHNLLDILREEPVDAKQPSYPADVYVELADCIVDLYKTDSYQTAQVYYKKAADTYRQERDFTKQVDVLKKWANASLSYQNPVQADLLLRTAVNTQEKQFNLSSIDLESFVDLEIADSYDKLAKVDPYAAPGDVYIPLPYDKLARNTRNLNFAINITGLTSGADEYFRELADAYVGIGKCRRAEKVYLLAIEETKKPEEGKELRNSFADLRLLVSQAEFYQNVLTNKEQAQKSIDEFAVEIGKRNPNDSFILREKLFERAGDFYFAKGDYPQAGKFYESVLQAIENSLPDIENLQEHPVFAEQKKRTYIEKTLNKAEVLVKTARVDEKQNKLDEAEKKYALAVSFVTSKFGANGIEMGKVLIPQADFYGTRGNKKKANEIYDKAEAFLTALNKAPVLNKFPKKTLEMQIHIQKNRGDMNRDNTEIAAKYYEQAISYLNHYWTLSLIPEEGSEEATRYTKNSKITEEYHIDELEIYKSWASLNGVKNAGELNEEVERAERIKDSAKKSQCYEDN